MMVSEPERCPACYALLPGRALATVCPACGQRLDRGDSREAQEPDPGEEQSSASGEGFLPVGNGCLSATLGFVLAVTAFNLLFRPLDMLLLDHLAGSTITTFMSLGFGCLVATAIFGYVAFPRAAIWNLFREPEE